MRPPHSVSLVTAALVGATLFAALFAGCATRPAEPVAVKVLAINDFHGYLETPQGGIRIADSLMPRAVSSRHARRNSVGERRLPAASLTALHTYV